MNATAQHPEYQNVPLALLDESPTNPRRHFDAAFLKELAASIRTNGVLTPLLVRPKGERLEIVFGGQRYRAAQIAEAETVPARIREMTDAQALEAQLVENLQRRDVHPMEEAEGFARLLALDEPTYTIEQIGARVGKSPAFIAQRLKLIDLAPPIVEAFYADEIGLGHALLLAKLPAEQQTEAFPACFKEAYNSGGQKPTRILLPVRALQFWIETNVLLILKDAPFDKRDTQLVPTAGSCADCSKRTGHNKLLFGDDLGKQGDRCTDPDCYNAKVAQHVAKTIAAKPSLVQISTAYGGQREGSTVLPRNKYTAIRDEKPKSKEEAHRPEFKVCKYAADAIIAEGSDVGSIHKVCANPACPIHHPKKATATSGRDAQFKAEQEKRRREEAVANATGLRVLSAIGAAVPVRLMKRDLLFVAERLANLLDENRVAILARQHGIKKEKDSGAVDKLFSAYLRRADESTLGRAVVESIVLFAASRGNAAQALRDAASAYKVDTDAIAATVKQEFAAKEKARSAKTSSAKSPKKSAARASKSVAA